MRFLGLPQACSGCRGKTTLEPDSTYHVTIHGR